VERFALPETGTRAWSAKSDSADAPAQSHRPTRRQERGQLGFQQVKRAQGFLDLHASITNLHGSARSTIPAHDRRSFLSTALQSWKAVVQQVA